MPTSVRRDSLNDYLQHKLVLAGAGPPEIETARSYLQATYSPLANAAWSGTPATAGRWWQPSRWPDTSPRRSCLGYFSATTGQSRDHWGFAWAPRNAAGIPAAEFAAQTGLVLDRLAAAVRDSGRTPDPADPGSAACGPPGQNVWCEGDLPGASLSEAWKSFRVWTQPGLTFATAPQTIPAGVPSAAMSLTLGTRSGLPVTTPTPLLVTLSSSSPLGGFSTTTA